jgi:hypothetical protein
MMARQAHHDAAAALLAWLDAMDDPKEQALAFAQGEEAALKALIVGGGTDASQRAYVRRWLESLAQNNAGLLAALTPSARK